MKYIKNFKFWILFILSLYTLIGFVAIPWFLTSQLPTFVKEKVGVNIALEQASFNPYSMEVSIENFTLYDLKSNPALTLGKIYINYSPLALLEKSIVVQNFEISNPSIFALLRKNGNINFENILPPSKNTKEVKDKEESSSAELPKILVQKFSINSGKLHFKDEKKDFTFDLGPYSFQAHDISPNAGNINAHNFETTIGTGGKVSWEGGVSVKPLALYGTLKVEELQLPTLYKYAINVIPAKLIHGKVSITLPYQVNLENKLQATISNAHINLKALTFSYTKQDVVDISNIDINDIKVSYPEQKVSVKSIEITRPTFLAVLNKQNSINFQKAFEVQMLSSKEKTATKNEPGKPWNFLVANTNVKDARVKFFDNSKVKQTYFELADATLDITNISSNKSLLIDYTLFTKINNLSTLRVGGSFNQESLFVNSAIDLKNLKLTYFTNYLQEFTTIKLKDGTINLDAKVKASIKDKTDIALNANTYINKLLVHSPDNKELLSWKQFAIKNIQYNHDPMKVDLGSLNFEQPFVKLKINKDGSTNFSNLAKADTKKKPVKEETPTSQKSDFQLKLGKITLNSAKANFSDMSLPFPFETNIHGLNGSFSELDFQKSTPSIVALEGKIDEYGYTNVKGDIVALDFKKHANIDVRLKNLDLTSLTPYSGKFVGRKIESGKLSMDLRYNIRESSLKGDNKLNLDTFTLGEEVEHPDAINLPLDLALALLKDSNGQIDIDLPISGDMNNPKFSYGSIVWKAVGNLITGIVTAPFRFLGNMLGIDGEKLKSVEFALGSSNLIVSEHEKLKNLEKILGKRPGIKLSIQGSYDDTLDTKILQQEKFKTIVTQEQKSIQVKDKKADVYSLALKSLYLKTNTIKSFEALSKTFIDKKTKKVDIVELNKKIANDLTLQVNIPKEELIALANKRAEVIKTSLHVKYKIAKNRIVIKKSVDTKAKRDQWVQVKLDITS